MANPSPFSLLDGLFQNLPSALTPPVWVIEEGHRRIVLLLNHVLQQEPQAMERLVRQKGRVVLMQWQHFTFKVQATPAGLLDLAAADAKADLTVVLVDESPFAMAKAWVQGSKPQVRIAGDVQLAAELNWLADHVRWDLEEDLARVLGDAPAHWLSQGARTVAQALQQWVGKVAAPATDTPRGTTA